MKTMKKLIFILLLLASCGTDYGTQDVKTLDGLKVRTVPMSDTHYPKYSKGDTVLIWRAYMKNDWHISIISTDCSVYDDFDVDRKKGVIQ